MTKARDNQGRFAAKNPGRPKGARNRTTLACQELLQGEAKKLTRKAIKLALEGHPVALKLVMERIAPVPRDRAIVVDLPALQTADDAPAALAAIVAAVGSGEITPAEGAELAKLVDAWKDAHLVHDVQKRIAAIEAAAEAGR